MFELIFEEISSKTNTTHTLSLLTRYHVIIIVYMHDLAIKGRKIGMAQRRFATSGTGEKFNSTEGILLAPPKDDLIF